MKINKFILLLTAVFTVLFYGIPTYAMTRQEADRYNNLYYPQSIYNGGINSAENDISKEAYVDPASGSTHIKVTDISLPGAGGFDLNITRTYNSQNAALFEAYLKEIKTPKQVTYYMIKGKKKVYKEYTNGTSSTTTYENICLTPDFMTYINSQNDVWLVKNSSKYEYEYLEQPAKSKLFNTKEEAQAAADYANSVLYEIKASNPYDNMTNCNIDYYSFSAVSVNITETVTEYKDSLLDDTAGERYSKLGAGWEFDFPYVETRYGYDTRYEYLHFGNKGIYLIDFSSDGGENHLAGYPLNDIILTRDTSKTHDGIQSKYLVAEKNGTKHYFGSDGRLLYQEDRFGNRISFYCDTEEYTNVWGQEKSYQYIKKIVDSIGRNIIFISAKETNGDITLKMTITNPNNAEDVKEYKYCLEKLSKADIGIAGYEECRELQFKEWVLTDVYDSENRREKYNYTFLKTKFSFMERNDDFYYEYYDAGDSSKGNSIVNRDNFEDFKGIHNSYALLTETSKSGYKSYYFDYALFVKNCTASGSMMFAKAYGYREETVSNYEEESYALNQKIYSSGINNNGEYDGYPAYRSDERIGADFNYEVKVTDGNLTENKYSYDIYKYSYVGTRRDKTILLSQLRDKGSDHNTVTDYSYDPETKLMLSVVQNDYAPSDSSVCMTFVKTYTYDSDKYGDVLTETPNNITDRVTAYTYDENYHFPTSKTHKQSRDKELKEEYISSADGKSIEYINIYENNVLKNKIQYEHDSYGNIVNQKAYADNFTDYTETEYIYQNGTYITAETTKTDNGNVMVSTVYDYWGNPIAKTDANGNTMGYTYDKINRITQITNPDGSTKIYTYRPASTIEKDELKNQIQTYYTKAHEIEGIRYNSLGVQYSNKYYDAFGRLETEVIYSDETDEDDYQKPHRITRYAYDTSNRPISKEVYDKDDMLIYMETYSYEIMNDCLKQTTAVIGDTNTPSVVVSEYYDSFGNKIKTESGTDFETYTYDYDRNVLSVKSARANDENWAESTLFEYNYMGKVIKETDVLGNSTRTEYDTFGRKVREYDQNGYAAEYKYDKLGRAVEHKSPIEKVSGVVYYAVKTMQYDNNGNLVSARVNTNASDETEKYSDTEYTYDNRNRLVMTKSFDGEKYNYVQNYYDKKGNILRVYTGLSNPIEVNGLDDVTDRGDNEYAVTKYSYDALSRVIETTDALGQNESNIYDNATGLVKTSIDRNGQNFNYTYDLNNRLTKSVEKTGNETRTTTMFYDKNGNQISKAVITNKPFGENVTGDYIVSQNSDKNVALYEYNCYNQLVGVDTNGKISSYTYAPDGMRASKTVDGNTINFVYDNANIVEEITADEVNKYFRGLEIIKNDEEMYYFYNGQGDVSMLADNAGNMAASYIFDAYGNQSEENTVYNPFGYRGEYTDAESGLVYLRARMYDSETGRFMSEDPAKAEFNWYVYCHNNSIKYIDPTGLDVYYFVNTEFKKEADKDQKKLANLYDEPVHVLETDSRESFIEEWNKMGSWDGEDVNVSLVVINMHGSPGSISPHPSGDTGSIRTADMENGTLIPKYIDNILCLGCNSGHFDHRYSSLMNKMLVKNVVKSVIASDGTVTSRSVFGNYKSKGDKTFVSYLWSGKKYRDNMGFVKYTKNDIGELEWEVLGKKINSKSIFNSLGR